MSRLVPGQGPTPSPLVLVGEAPGINEEIYRRPFIGESGKELDRMLVDAGLDRKNHYATNVFKRRPPDNKILEYFVSRTNPAACMELPPYKSGKYLRSDLLDEVRSLVPELVGVGAKVVVALGGTALWALLGYSKISAYVGTLHPPSAKVPFWVVPTYHPTAVLHNWSFRDQVVSSLVKAKTQLGKTGTGRPSNAGGGPDSLRIKVNPTLAECQGFARRAAKAPVMAVDVETIHGQIRTISFSLTPTTAFVIPFWEPPRDSYWPTMEGEVAAWECVRLALSGPGTKIFQNGLYDTTYLWRVHGIPVYGPIEDTLLAQHALDPELPKGLAQMAAAYLALPEWKQAVRGKAREEKDTE